MIWSKCGIRKLIRWARGDAYFATTMLLITGVLLWILLTPILPSVAIHTLQRFHLRTNSFAAWALQFPIPSMYNFANEYQIDDYPSGLVTLVFEEETPRFLNHFPARCFTFADARGQQLREGHHKWVTLETSYRGQKLVSKFHLQPQPVRAEATPARRYEVIRTPTP